MLDQGADRFASKSIIRMYYIKRLSESAEPILIEKNLNRRPLHTPIPLNEFTPSSLDSFSVETRSSQKISELTCVRKDDRNSLRVKLT